MKIFRIILLGLAMALFVVNFLTIDFQDLSGTQSLWAYCRIAIAFVLILLLVSFVRKDRKKAKKIKIASRIGHDDVLF